nr:primosomal replication protein [Pantoea sp. 201603H]
MKSALLLQQLEARLEQLAATLSPRAEQQTSRARFDRQLFRCHGTRLGDYLQEARQTLSQLKQSALEKNPDRLTWLAEHMVLQMGALQREIATQPLRQREPQASRAIDTLDQKLAEHQGFEQRLIMMLSDREKQLGQQETLRQQQQIQRELTALEARLLRCREAITLIEQAIQQRDG